jgi:hypothetical protein
MEIGQHPRGVSVEYKGWQSALKMFFSWSHPNSNFSESKAHYSWLSQLFQRLSYILITNSYDTFIAVHIHHGSLLRSHCCCCCRSQYCACYGCPYLIRGQARDVHTISLKFALPITFLLAVTLTNSRLELGCMMITLLLGPQGQCESTLITAYD